MITRERILQYLDNLPSAGFDMPFAGDFYSTVLRITTTRKWFGVLLKAPARYCEKNGIYPCLSDGADVLNLKCPPDLRVFLCERFRGAVVPAYHMSKTQWISVVLDSDMPEEEILKLIDLSYELVKKELK